MHLATFLAHSSVVLYRYERANSHNPVALYEVHVFFFKYNFYSFFGDASHHYVGELKNVLLRRHTQPSLLAYCEETATVMRNLDCDLVLVPLNREEDWAMYPPGQAPPQQDGPRAVPGLPRKSLRRASASVQRLRRVVGSSKVLYRGVMAHCRLHYAEHALEAVCSLRWGGVKPDQAGRPTSCRPAAQFQNVNL